MRKRMLFLILFIMIVPLSALSSSAPAFTTDRDLPDAMQGVYYSTRIKAKGSNPLTFTFSPGDYAAHSVPKGLTMNKEGIIYGTPQKAGTYRFVVQAEDKTIPAQTTDVFTLTVKAFDEGSLNEGGTNTDIIGSGFDNLTGVANAPNGGKAAMGKGLLFFVDERGYLKESKAPFRNAERTYGAVEYDCLDTLDNDLYYYHHYLHKRGQPAETFTVMGRGKFTIPATKNQYVTRIVQDSIAKKGREVLVMLDKRISNLSLTREIVLYIEDGLLKRTGITTGKENTLRAYVNGQEIRAESAFPFNGYAYFTAEEDGRLYRVPLDGQVAQTLSDGQVTAFTAGIYQGQPALFFSDASLQLFRAELDGASAMPLEGLKAGALNADSGRVYFTNASDNYTVYSLEPDSEVAVKLSGTPAKNIYVFDAYLAFEPQNENTFIILPKEGGDEAVLKR